MSEEDSHVVASRANEDDEDGPTTTAATTPPPTRLAIDLDRAERGTEESGTQGPCATHGDMQSEVAEVAQADAGARLDLPPVQVCVRLRPLLAWERESGHATSSLELSTGARGSVTLRPREGCEESSRTRTFRFDAVLGQTDSQQEAWELANVDRMVDKVVAGFNATIFAYGQTGSGKTHTMEGYAYNHHNGAAAPSADAGRARVKLSATPPEQLGFVPRAVATLFSKVEALQSKLLADGKSADSVILKVSFLQIYKERVYDLLNPVHTLAKQEAGKGEEVAGLRLRWHPARRQFFVENLFEYECNSAEEVLEHYVNGIKNKHVASTAMNVASSRSHTVLMLTLVRHTNLQNDGSSADAAATRRVVSKMALVDLAGSERASATSGCDKGALRFQEAVNINQSLFVLRKVITALSRRQVCDDNATHVPYRESKLTSLLQHSIGGNSFLLMLACLSPSDKHYEENLSTLQYASQAANIKNVPKLNLDPKDRLIQELRAQLVAAHAYILRTSGLTELPAELLHVTSSCASSGPRRASLPSSSRTRSGASSGSRSRRPPPAEGSAGDSGSVTPNSRVIGGSRDASQMVTSLSSTAPVKFTTSDVRHSPRAAFSTSRPSIERESGKPRVSSIDIRTKSEGQQLFTATDAMIAGYGEDATGTRSSRVGHPQQTPHSARTPRAGAKDKSHFRPPSLPPAGVGLPPLATDGQRKASLDQSSLSAYRGQAPVPPKEVPIRNSARARPRSGEKSQKDALESSGSIHSQSGVVAATADTTRSTTATSDSSDPIAPKISCAEMAAQRYAESGLWEAVEELRQTKVTLEQNLEEANARAEKLQAKLQEMETSHTLCTAPTATSLAATNAHVENVAATERTNDTARIASLESENDQLRLESRNLQDRLDIFYSAMELESRSPTDTTSVDSPPAADHASSNAAAPRDDGLAARVERLHAKLIVDAVGLRNEVAGLKKKKWILRAIASGGENEKRAIDDEIEELKRNKREAPLRASATLGATDG